MITLEAFIDQLHGKTYIPELSLSKLLTFPVPVFDYNKLTLILLNMVE